MWLMMVNDFSLSFSLVHVRQFYIISNRFMINYADENHTEYRIKPWIIDIAFRLNCSTLLAVHRLFLSGVAFSPICIYGTIFKYVKQPQSSPNEKIPRIQPLLYTYMDQFQTISDTGAKVLISWESPSFKAAFPLQALACPHQVILL